MGPRHQSHQHRRRRDSRGAEERASPEDHGATAGYRRRLSRHDRQSVFWCQPGGVKGPHATFAELVVPIGRPEERAAVIRS